MTDLNVTVNGAALTINSTDNILDESELLTAINEYNAEDANTSNPIGGSLTLSYSSNEMSLDSTITDGDINGSTITSTDSYSSSSVSIYTSAVDTTTSSAVSSLPTDPAEFLALYESVKGTSQEDVIFSKEELNLLSDDFYTELGLYNVTIINDQGPDRFDRTEVNIDSIIDKFCPQEKYNYHTSHAEEMGLLANNWHHWQRSYDATDLANEQAKIAVAYTELYDTAVPTVEIPTDIVWTNADGVELSDENWSMDSSVTALIDALDTSDDKQPDISAAQTAVSQLKTEGKLEAIGGALSTLFTMLTPEEWGSTYDDLPLSFFSAIGSGAARSMLPDPQHGDTRTKTNSRYDTYGDSANYKQAYIYNSAFIQECIDHYNSDPANAAR